jgi:hypothetical protein
MNFRFTVIAWAILLGIFHPARLLAEATNPPYIAEMPTVDSVMKAMQASDPDETAARQMGAFWQLKTMIEELAGPRYYRPGLTPEEAKLRQAYYTAYAQISNSKQQYKSFVAMRGYDINPKFRSELIQKLFPPAFAAEYPKLMAQANAQTQAVHNQAEEIRAMRAAEEQAQAQKALNQPQVVNSLEAAINARKTQPPMTPEQRALNRCITSGRLPASCTGNSLLGGLTQMISQFLPGAKEPAPGPNMAGVFQGAGNWRLDFIEGGVLVNCSFLSPDQHNYTLEFKDNRTALIIDTTPKPLVLTLRADGTIVGPGPLQIDGVVPAGTTPGHTTEGHDETHVVTSYETVPASDPRAQGQGLCPIGGCQVPTTHTETTHVGGTYEPGTTIFAPKRATCPAPNLSSKGAGVGIETMQTDLLKTMFGGEKGPPTPPGIRMHGTYAASTGFSVEFFPESVILGCGPDVARAYPYTVRADGSPPVIKVEAPDHPLTLVMKPNGTLDPGSGPYEVQGRTIKGRDSNDDFTFAPLNATCNLAALAPGEIPSAPVTTTTAPAPGATTKPARLSTPAAPTGNAVLVVTSGLSPQPGGPNPLGGHTFVLLNQSYESALASAGFQPQGGMSLLKVYLMACMSQKPACQQGIAATNASTVSGTRADANGKGQLPGVPVGTYYFFCAGGYNKQLYKWDFKVDLKPGTNSITLDQRNAAPVN